MTRTDPARAQPHAATMLEVERMPLALCCDDPSEVRWRAACAGRRLWPLHWEAPQDAASLPAPDASASS
ncbi:MAG: hypothetical protein IT532_14105 [Burkholderiales bacterium]|nr:hypothetical protein [Burkholderiales bacterium]